MGVGRPLERMVLQKWSACSPDHERGGVLCFRRQSLVMSWFDHSKFQMVSKSLSKSTLTSWKEQLVTRIWNSTKKTWFLCVIGDNTRPSHTARLTANIWIVFLLDMQKSCNDQPALPFYILAKTSEASWRARSTPVRQYSFTYSVLPIITSRRPFFLWNRVFILLIKMQY